MMFLILVERVSKKQVDWVVLHLSVILSLRLSQSCFFGRAEKDTEPAAKPRAKPAAKKAPKKVVELDDSDDEDFTTNLRERLASYNAKVTQPSVVIGEFRDEDSPFKYRRCCTSLVLHIKAPFGLGLPFLRLNYSFSILSI